MMTIMGQIVKFDILAFFFKPNYGLYSVFDLETRGTSLLAQPKTLPNVPSSSLSTVLLTISIKA